MKLTRFDVISDMMESLAKDKVNFYWETEDSYPVIEVFMYDTNSGVISTMEEIEKRIMEDNIPRLQYDVDTETLNYDTNYQRIMIYFGKNIVDTDLIKMINILKDYGSHIHN
jgi:hypothetical protein